MNHLLRKVAVTALSVTMVTSSFAWVGGQQAYAAENTATTSSKGVTQAYESLFQTDNVIDVKITIDDADWQSMLESPMDKDYKQVSVEVDGNKLDNVGFSTKGNMTLRSVASMEDSDRYSFRLKFDKYDKTQTLLGLDKMVLNNNYTDPSYMREILHYEALRSIGMDVPMTNYVNLYVNGELVGFYTGVEAVDDSYLERNYGENYEDGVLYDTEEKSYLQYEEDGDYSTLSKDLGSDKDKTKLKNFIQTLNEMPEGEKGDVESVLDVDSALQYIAGNTVLGNYDSYNGDKGHNYMLYSDATGKFTVVPWDFNMSFNGYSAGGGGRGGATAGSTMTNTNATNVSVDEPVLGISMESVPMINNLLAVPEYKEKYLTYVNELTDYLEGIQDRITELSAKIRPYVDADPTKFYTTEQFESNIVYSANGDTGSGMGGGMTPPEGFEGMTPPEGMEGMTPPEGMEGMTPPDGTTPPTRPSGTAASDGTTEPTANTSDNSTRPGGNFGGGQGMGSMASGSITTFALNRLANLQEQLGREVTPLPETDEQPDTTTSNETTEQAAISVTVDGQTVTFPGQEPLEVSGQVMVPVNAIFEAVGAEVTWNPTAKTVTAVLNDQTFVLKIGSSTTTVNDTSVEIDSPAIIKNSRTLVPVRFISEALGLKVDWDQSTATVKITSQ